MLASSPNWSNLISRFVPRGASGMLQTRVVSGDLPTVSRQLQHCIMTTHTSVLVGKLTSVVAI